MGKTSASELVEAIADNFNTYIGKGVRLEPLLSDFDPNLNVNNLNRLLRIHFVLTENNGQEPGVIDFVRALPNRIRRLKTTSSRRLVKHEGEVRGQIAWNETVKRRYREGGRGNRYVCRETQKEYDIEENVVLKVLLNRIHQIVFEDLEYAIDAPEDYNWLADWVDSQNQLAETFDEIFRDHVYLRRIDAETHEVTNRTLRSVMHSRNPLYAEAAQLLDRYQRLMNQNLDSSETRQLLQNTFVRPEETETLFELYWVFRILDCYDEVEFEILDEGSDVVASWATTDSRYVLYHDSTGGSALSFRERLSDVDRPSEDGYLFRTIRILEQWQQTAGDWFDVSGGDSLWGGRPDIILERYDTDREIPSAVFVGEVKYTTNTSYATQGLRELLEYMAYVRREDEYLEEKDDVLNSERVTGILFVDDVGATSNSRTDVQLLRFGDTIPKLL